MIIKLLKRKTRDVFGKFSPEEYQEINNIQSKEDLAAYQEKSLQNLIIHAYNNVDYYKTITNQVGLYDGHEVDLSKFGVLPVLNKEKILNDRESLLSQDYDKRGWYYNYSGGSTGEPMTVIQDQKYKNHSYASNYYYHNNILGIDEFNAKKIILWGSPRDVFKGSIGLKAKITNWFTNTIILDSFVMTINDMDKYIKIINSYKPDIIRGYSASLYELCKYIKSKGIDIYTPKILIGSSETLNCEMRRLIEEVFGTKIYDFYGSREINNLAGECKEGMMHILPSNIIEVVGEDNKSVLPGETGKVIVTNLFNYAMPFLRYQIGDMATLGSERCKCGNILPTLEKIHGRIFEHLILEDGTVVEGMYFIQLLGVYCNKGSIDQFQVIQKDYNDIKIKVVSNSLDQNEIKELNQKIRLVMGQNCNIEWDYVDQIEKTPSGKYLYTKSMVIESILEK